MLIAAVAAGAVAAATHTTGGSTADAAGDEPDTTLLFDNAAGTGPLDQIADDAGPAGPVVHEVLAITRESETLDQLNALTRITDEGLSEPEPTFQLGVPYVAGNDENLDGWIAQALGLMGLPQSIAPGLKKIIMHESTGNPRAINLWDSNALRGTPSQGLMQTIPSVYERCVLPSLADRPITDPVANITAGVRAMIANHGLETLVAGGRKSASGNYLGYGGAASCDFEMTELDPSDLDLSESSAD